MIAILCGTVFWVVVPRTSARAVIIVGRTGRNELVLSAVRVRGAWGRGTITIDGIAEWSEHQLAAIGVSMALARAQAGLANRWVILIVAEVIRTTFSIVIALSPHGDRGWFTSVRSVIAGLPTVAFLRGVTRSSAAHV